MKNIKFHLFIGCATRAVHKLKYSNSLTYIANEINGNKILIYLRDSPKRPTKIYLFYNNCNIHNSSVNVIIMIIIILINYFNDNNL